MSNDGKDTVRLFDKRMELTAAELGEAIGKTTGAIYVLVHRRQIPYKKRGKRLVFIPDEIRAWLNNGGATNVS